MGKQEWMNRIRQRLEKTAPAAAERAADLWRFRRKTVIQGAVFGAIILSGVFFAWSGKSGADDFEEFDDYDEFRTASSSVFRAEEASRTRSGEDGERGSGNGAMTKGNGRRETDPDGAKTGTDRAAAAGESLLTETDGSQPTDPDFCYIHLSGAVARPGVYPVLNGARLTEAVRLAGGLLPEADVSGINLAMKVADESKVHIPAKGERPVQAGPEGASGGGEYYSSGTGGTAGNGVGPGGVSSRVNLNTAGIDQLQTLTGVGPSTAQKIIDYRTRFGKFRSVDDLTNISGIGPKTLDRFRHQVSI